MLQLTEMTVLQFMTIIETKHKRFPLNKLMNVVNN